MKKYYTLIARGKVAGAEILDKKLVGRTVVPVRIGMNQKIEAQVSTMYDYNHLDGNGNPTEVIFPNVLGDTVRVNFCYSDPSQQDGDGIQTNYEYKGRLFTSAAEAVAFLNEQYGFLAEFKQIGNSLFVVSHMFPGKLNYVYVTILWD